jgi:hypothetical protein
MTLSTPIKIILACVAVAALVLTAMSGDSKSAGLKGSGRKLQFGRPAKIIKKRNDSLIVKPGEGAQPQLDNPEKNIKMRNDSLIIKTGDGTATTTTIIVNAGNAAAP